MSDPNDAPENLEAEIEADVEMLSELLVHEYDAVERAAGKVKAKSALAREMGDSDLIAILARLRVARAVDDFTSIYLDLKDEEAETARELLDELGDDEFDDEYEDEDDFEDFEDDDFEDDDEFGEFEDDDEDDEDDDEAA